MSLALACTIENDPYHAWQAANGAAHCQRMAATISLIQCFKNQDYSRSNGGDCRCNGCGGLYDQTPPVKLFLVWNAADKTEPEVDAPSGSGSTPAEKDVFADLDAIINELYEEPETDDDFIDVELDLDDEQLLALFPELALSEEEDNEINYPRFTEYQTAMPRYAVYKGHCRKCGGYVDNCRERDDDNVFHCLSCGWRTGPEYELNRIVYGVN